MFDSIVSQFKALPTVVKNLLIINVLFFLAGYALPQIFSATNLGIHYFDSPNFKPWQIFTHFFTHANFTHLLFNMLGLWMFGIQLERIWGPKRFLSFYLLCAMGGVLLPWLAESFQVYSHTGSLFNPRIKSAVAELLQNGQVSSSYFPENSFDDLSRVYATPSVGASGAIFGVLGAFAMLFPNTPLVFIFFPVPIKAKYLVNITVIVSLALGLNKIFHFFPSSLDFIGHFAHLGGWLVGVLIVWYWNKTKKNTFY